MVTMRDLFRECNSWNIVYVEGDLGLWQTSQRCMRASFACSWGRNVERDFDEVLQDHGTDMEGIGSRKSQVKERRPPPRPRNPFEHGDGRRASCATSHA